MLDYVNSENRLRYPEYRAPCSDKWQRISWEEAFSRIAKLMKADRDANFIEKNEQGVTVNRWLSTGMLCFRCQQRNRDADSKFARSLGMLAVDNRARLTRTNGSKSCSNIWSRCDDQPLGGYQNANVVMVMGGNAAEAHPVGFRWAMEAKTTTMQP